MITECTTGSHVTEMLVRFVFVFVLHAVPLTCVFVRWGHRFYWGFFPATFTALGLMLGSDMNSPCAMTQTEFLSITLAAVFVSISYISLIFFKPNLHFLALGGEGHVPVVLALPILGAAYAAVWLLLSVGRPRLLMDTGQPVTFKERVFETLAHSVLAAAVCVLLASAISG